MSDYLKAETFEPQVTIGSGRLAHLERCAKAVEWVEKHRADVEWGAPHPWVVNWPDGERGFHTVIGPTWLAAVENAMKETP